MESYNAEMIPSVPSSQFIAQGVLTSDEEATMKRGLEMSLGVVARRLEYEKILAKRSNEAQGAVLQLIKHFDAEVHQ